MRREEGGGRGAEGGERREEVAPRLRGRSFSSSLWQFVPSTKTPTGNRWSGTNEMGHSACSAAVSSDAAMEGREPPPGEVSELLEPVE